jgi:mannitol/fructose-specific phosphotransferase system IIA component (Ntr-type)
MMNKDDFRERLIEAKSQSDIINIFREEEENYFDV